MKKTKPFVAGSICGALLFLAINICTYDNGLRGTGSSTGESATECFDCLKQVGWPFRLYQSGGILHVDKILWVGLIADTLIATLVIIAMGLLIKMFLPNVAVSASRLTHKQD